MCCLRPCSFAGAMRWRVAALTIFPICAWGRFQSDVITLGNPGEGVHRHKANWHFISKFAYGADGGHVSIRIREVDTPHQTKYEYDQSLSIDFMMYDDEQWESVPDMVSMRHCTGRSSSGKKANLLNAEDSVPEPTTMLTVDFAHNNDWGEWMNSEIGRMRRPRMWYFVLSDCENKLTDMNVKYELVFQQAGGSEFSVERQNSLAAHTIALLLNLALCIWWYSKISNMPIKSAFEFHPMLWVLSAQLGLQLLGHLGHLWHLTDYREDGIGNMVVDIAAELFFMANQTLQCSLLITVGLGYTITPADFFNDSDSILVVVLLMMIVHAFLVLISHMSNGEQPHKFHGHEGPIGWCLVVIRVLFYIWFMWASQTTKENGTSKLRGFMTKFQVLGSLSFLAYPITFCILPFVADYWRHRVMQAAVMSVQFIVNICFARLFLKSPHFNLEWKVIPTGPHDYRFNEDEFPGMPSEDMAEEMNRIYSLPTPESIGHEA